ncbi:MAG TPA: NADH-quinone oxidoreductase subunit I [Actinomycetota bacterium]|nr:NADH-quinone oxidoreductase subunit I [Actinomycetota bacterium]
MPALKGVGLLKGLGVTFRTMSRRAATQQYPHVKPNLPARSRGVIALIEENCTVCMLCSRECPDWCIYIDSHKETVAPKEGGRARTRNILDRFAIDFALCMYCGICVEVCPFDALHWSPEFEYAEYSHEALTHEMDTLRQWAYTVPAPDPLEVGAEEPREIESARKAREALRAKAAAAAEQAAAPAPAAAAAPPAAPTEARPSAAPAEPAAPAPAAPAQEVQVEPGIDQETYDRLVAAGEPERTARAKAKAAYMRKAKAEARAAAGSVDAPPPAPAAPPEPAPPAAPEPASAAAPPEPAPPAAPEPASAAAPEPAPAAGGEAEHLEVEIDQETYDRLIAAGEADRTARAKAKAAYARKLRAAQRGGGGGGS